ncbi:AAA family ATPase [Spongiibacter nanhainus]|uniref:AAA family ATPase n=1 Tax=Spongiibacter nanhainus TaxID=2794344 RepID=A0A7T4UPZ9_9GAMM|nr:AAA family ATPase [Spongiibacter nanhainus]QQD18213.1 AAA family ATPase [Spongiibacter nanhainus]
MSRIVIFGNSGSGKSTLAHTLCERHGLAHLDLDTIAWLPTTPPQRRPVAESQQDIDAFINAHTSTQGGWVIEGCYSDLLELAAPSATDLVFLDLPIEDCIANARARPWEPHKYASKADQDANLAMLIDWIGQYQSRQDGFSRTAHQQLFESFTGNKVRYTSNRP